MFAFGEGSRYPRRASGSTCHYPDWELTNSLCNAQLTNEVPVKCWWTCPLCYVVAAGLSHAPATYVSKHPLPYIHSFTFTWLRQCLSELHCCYHILLLSFTSQNTCYLTYTHLYFYLPMLRLLLFKSQKHKNL